MPKYDERFAQEAQEEEYLRLKYLDDEYWYAMWQENEQSNQPAIVGIAINSIHDMFMVCGKSREEVYQKVYNHNLKLLQTFEPKQVI